MCGAGACSPARGRFELWGRLDLITDRMVDSHREWGNSRKEWGNSRKDWGTAMVQTWTYPHCILP